MLVKTVYKCGRERLQQLEVDHKWTAVRNQTRVNERSHENGWEYINIRYTQQC